MLIHVDLIKTFSKLAAALFFSLATFTVSAKALDNEDKMDNVSDTFMAQVAMGETEAALSLISAYIGVNAEQFKQRGDAIINDMKQINTSAGKPIAYALLKKQTVEGHFYKLSYLLKFAHAALVWELNFYQADKGWHLVDVNFNTNINGLFDN